MIQFEFFARNLVDAEDRAIHAFHAAVPLERREGWTREVDLVAVDDGHNVPTVWRATASFYPPDST